MTKQISKYIPLLIVTKGNSDGSIRTGDIVHYDIKGNLVLHLSDKKGGGLIEKNELNKSIIDFEYKIYHKYKVLVVGNHEKIVRGENK